MKKLAILLGATILATAAFAGKSTSTTMEGSVSKPSQIEFVALQSGGSNSNNSYNPNDFKVIGSGIDGSLSKPLSNILGGNAWVSMIYSGITQSTPIKTVSSGGSQNTLFIRLINEGETATTTPSLNISLSTVASQPIDYNFTTLCGFPGYSGYFQSKVFTATDLTLPELDKTVDVMEVYDSLASAQAVANNNPASTIYLNDYANRGAATLQAGETYVTHTLTVNYA
jgi:hypothetical protein